MLRLSSFFAVAALLVAQDRPVLLNVGVENYRGVVDGLQPDAFEVYENGIAQTVLSARESDSPISMGILIDNSSGMAGAKARAAVDAARALVLDSNPRNEIFVVNYNDTAFMDQTLTSNRDLLERAIANMNPQGEAATLDAVAMAEEYLRKEGKNLRKVLIVISGSAPDRSANASFEAILGQTRRPDGVAIYGIGMLWDADTESAAPVRVSLNALARESGGLTYFPDERSVGLSAERMAARLRFRYEVLYVPSSNFDGKLRTVSVNLARTTGYLPVTVRVRTAYTAEWTTQ